MCVLCKLIIKYDILYRRTTEEKNFCEIITIESFSIIFKKYPFIFFVIAKDIFQGK